MPQAIPAIASTVGTVIFGAGTTGAVVATAVTSAALGLGFTYAVGAGLNALAGEPDVAGLDTQGGGRQLSFSPSSNMPRQIIYGETLVRGQPVFTKTSGTDRKNLDMIIAIGDAGPYESIEAIYFNEEELTLDGSGNVTSPSKYAGFAQIVTTLGSESQTAISDAVSNITEWTSAHTGKGVCHAYVRLIWDPEVWTGGQPQIKFKVRGRKVYDPRLDSTNGGSGSHRKDDATTWEYSANRVLWALDWIRGVKMNGERVAGLGAPNTLIDWGTWADAADAADENVAVVGAGTISRYTGGGGQIGTDDDPAGVARGMAQCFAGEYAPRSGYIACYAGEARTSTVTLSDDDLAGPIKLQTARSMRDTVNTIQAQYREPEEDYDFTDAPQYQNASWVSDDGEEYYKQIGLPFEVDHRRAQRIAKIIAARLREPRRLEATWKQKGLQVREGDAFTWSSDRFPAGVVGKYICTDRRINADGTVFISARSEDDTKYDWTPGTEEATRTTPASISEPDTAITVPVSSLDPTTNRNAILGALPEYTLGLFFTLPAYDINGSGSVSFEDTLDLGGGFLRDSGGNALTDTTTLNASIEIDVNGALTNIGTASTPVANNFIGVVSGLIDGIGTGNGTAVGNTLISLSADGTLSGAGSSSQVDATQIVNGVADAGATAGADWASNLTSRPTELTDGRVSAGLDASGDLNRDITTARATSSNILRRTGGGLFSGDLAATAGADWASNLSNRPTELTDGRVSAGLDASGDLNRDITTARANSSNILRRTSGGLFTGDLAATAGADWSSNLTNRPTELTDGRVSTGLNASGVLLTNVPNASQIPTLDTSKIGSGTFANARIAQSNVTQHEAAVNALNLTNGPAEASATAGATWGSDITSQPSWSTDDRVPDTISDSEEITKNTKVVQLTSGTASRSLGRAVEFLEVQDGDSITFTTNFGKVPNVRIIGGTGLSFAVASGADFGDTNNQYQAFRATNLTTSGFDVSAKIRQAPTTTAQNDSVASTGTGSEPDLVGQKSTADEAGDDTYRFSGTVSATFTGPAICTIGVYTLDSGTSTWVKRNETTVSLVSGSAVSWSANAVVDGLTQDGGGDQEFGVSIESESGVFSVNPSLASVAVAYDSVSTLTETSATPTGEYVYALVFESDEVLT